MVSNPTKGKSDIKTQACPECGKSNGYFKIDGTFRCRSCNFTGQVK